ncbi:receptor activity-modifying protein 3 [Amia ocellicauda]|uniref:receptor activity-modifying protein 3 n=1 Tax=Amia ocellicauda TaxID=2972642 RepID=UPI003463D487
MDKNALLALQLFVLGIFLNALMTCGLSATENKNKKTPSPSQLKVCNETALQLVMEGCGDIFKHEMMHVDSRNWCNLTHFIWVYYDFSSCTEKSAQHMGCYWPNPQVESYIISIHKHFFLNCSLDRVMWLDPPDDTLTVLIFVPVCLTLAMIALVVWCSKRSDILL